ncbi:phosphoribosylformylglycinamidine synthase subunit PurS [bacterium]|nr:phosphoribosylformylglycinamidine synthase subunit PurS [bacterium]
MKAKVYIRLKEGVLDVQGQVVLRALRNLGFDEVENVRIGKLIEMEINNPSEERIKEMCERMLANPVVEDYEIVIEDKR